MLFQILGEKKLAPKLFNYSAGFNIASPRAVIMFCRMCSLSVTRNLKGPVIPFLAA
jgi:hypothetical protein